jgi:predicted dehydrogenase
MAAAHIKAYRQLEGVEIAALCNPSGRNLDGDFSRVSGNVGDANPLKLDMSVVKAFRTAEELFADSTIDAVDICTPTSSHLPLAMGALAAGKHVLIEKPLARKSAEAAELLAAASKSDRIVMPAMCMRFWPGWSWLKAAIDSGRFGRVLSARFRRVAEAPRWGRDHFFKGADSGGALLDLHIHDVDFIQFLFGKPHSVYAKGHTRVSGAIDHVLAMYEVDGGAVVSAEGSWAMAPGYGFSMSYTINFERATVDFDPSRAAEPLRLIENGEAKKMEIEAGDGYMGELRYFLDCIAEHRKPSVVTLEDAVSALRICEAESASIETGRPAICG